MNTLTMTKSVLAVLSMLATGSVGFALPDVVAPTSDRAAAAIHSMAGCYLVDYNYAETESLRPGYERDARLYDVNRDRIVKELIYTEDLSPTRIRVQHILFATDPRGVFDPKSVLKHQADDWEAGAPYRYDFVGGGTWNVITQEKNPTAWTRRVTNLDDGLRYQCTSPWDYSSGHAVWSCDDLAPIPGRETRDMGRKDYDLLQRSTTINVYQGPWLERQANVKETSSEQGPSPLARESGKNWYIPINVKECDDVRPFVEQRKAFWSLLRETWDDVLDGRAAFREQAVANAPPRYAVMGRIEDKYIGQNLRAAQVREQARNEILEVIEAYRKK